MRRSPNRVKKVVGAWLSLALITTSGVVDAAPPSADAWRDWVATMKTTQLGPFDQIRWYCKDGAVLLPTPGACESHGGGNQHGQWSAQTTKLRAAGFTVANFLADLDPDVVVTSAPNSDLLPQLLIEQFLIRIDDGWILRGARYYRGTFQEEDERRGARELLLRMAVEPAYSGPRYLMLRTAVAALPHGRETPSIRGIRQASAALSDRDPGFKPLRNKIHGHLARQDADAVRQYATAHASAEARGDYFQLATAIDEVFTRDTGLTLTALAAKFPPSASLTTAIKDRTALWTTPLPSAEARAHGYAELLATLRDALTSTPSATLRLQVLDASLMLEAEYFALQSELKVGQAKRSRRAQLDDLVVASDALYGVGLLSPRQRAVIRAERTLLGDTTTDSVSYKKAVDYLALVANWATQNYRFLFGSAMERLTIVEPKAGLFIQDALRASPLFFYAAQVDALVRDANRLRGVRNELFGADAGSRLRALNPGLARGHLHVVTQSMPETVEREGIYVLAETIAELPPIAGIITAGEGNPLSHVQLLARNLGIPNVVIDEGLLDTLKRHDGNEVVLAVSPAGSVRLADMNDEFANIFASDISNVAQTVIKVDLAKLALDVRRFIPLTELRATDSGRVVGPKAAKLGELKAHFPDAVANGLAIPFGMFRALLEQPMPDTDTTVFTWMQHEYARLAALPAADATRRTGTEAFRARLHNWITHADPGAAFREALSAKMREMFGPDGSFGVFVRSDTNVEDLAGFTGAGLNLTLPNVVGFDNIFKAIAEVWASPFSARSFAWRQSLMDSPEHVYPAVLLLQSVDNDKSGVLVTHDIDTGSADWLSVALNEGVGGAVDGQSAESLRLNVNTGAIRLLAQATAPVRRQIANRGGISKLAASGNDTLLQPAEAEQLVTLARELPTKFPPVLDASGRPAPADIEFGFLKGQLRLFQIRPFLDNDRARGTAYLQTMDAPTATKVESVVDLNALPETSATAP
ncbi:MAG: phosphoenolpyruvate synthase [Gammaproteobacteria bacterium]|nr:phosphoenolpyruvate synthase [Gammaproteobacteria bacterium]